MNTRERYAFRMNVREHYRREGRALPWRRTRDPYRIWVSEMMLQQTQVERVVPKYRAFLKQFPTIRALAGASRADVLRAWQGLGYNRRAKFLHEAAHVIAREHGGVFPRSVTDIERLPGIGHYTARAIVTFAHDQPEVFIETNIRTVYLHHFFTHQIGVADAALMPYISDTLDTKHPREWYWALMDYGAWLKKEHGNVSCRSAHHTTQSKFEGSVRQLRGLILKTVLAQKRIGLSALAREVRRPTATVRTVADALVTEGLIMRSGHTYRC